MNRILLMAAATVLVTGGVLAQQSAPTPGKAAIDMAKVVLANGKDAETKKLAQDIIATQEKEIATIDAWLKKKG